MKAMVQARAIIGMVLLLAVLLSMTSLIWKWVDKGRKRDRLLSERLEALETKVKNFETELAELKRTPRQVSGSTGGAPVMAPPASVAANAIAPRAQQQQPPAPPIVEPVVAQDPPKAVQPAAPPPAAPAPPPAAPSIPLPPIVAKPAAVAAPHIELADFAPKPASSSAVAAANAEVPPFNASHHYLHNIVVSPQDQLKYEPSGSDWCHECYHWWSRFADEDDAVPPARLEQIRTAIAKLIANQNAMKAGTLEHKSVVIKPPGVQLCNRLRNLMVGVILAMLTDRAVQYSFKSGYYADFTALFDSPLDLNPFSPGGGGTVVSGAGGYDAALCDDLAHGEDAKAAVLSIDHHTWIAPLLYINPHLGPVMEAKTGGLQGIYKATFMNLFMPSLNVRQRIEGFFKEHSLYDRPLLAMHLRSGPDFRPPMTKEEWAGYGRCAQYITERLAKRAGGGEGRKKPAWFIAADLEESRARAQVEFAQYNAELIFYSDWLRSNNEEGVQRAVTELLLVAIADGRVLTPGSSYSEFSFSLAGPESDTVFSLSNAPNGPKFGYQYSEELAPGCRRPKQADPSLQELDQILKRSKCKSAINESKAQQLYKR